MRFSRCKLRRKSSSPRKAFRAHSTVPSGFTLMEVVVGLTLMATVLVGSLLSFSAHRRQLRRADAKIAAVAVADDLLSRFMGSREGIPLLANGSIDSHPTWYWQTQPVGTTAPAGVPLQVIRLQVIEITASGEHRVHTSVDVVRRSNIDTAGGV